RRRRPVAAREAPAPARGGRRNGRPVRQRPSGPARAADRAAGSHPGARSCTRRTDRRGPVLPAPDRADEGSPLHPDAPGADRPAPIATVRPDPPGARGLGPAAAPGGTTGAAGVRRRAARRLAAPLGRTALHPGEPELGLAG